MGCLGLSICYDIRFPELHRYMVLRGAQVVFAPANLQMATGKDHREAILRRRAIENSCYVVAAAQYGRKRRNGSHSFGDSIIIDPRGTVIARAPECVSVALAIIDPDYLEKIRSSFPSLKNRRSDVYDM